jgi:phosphoenolpyruvate carboxylase
LWLLHRSLPLLFTLNFARVCSQFFSPLICFLTRSIIAPSNYSPELELSGLNVGSRPAKRNPKGGVESLRAIPWQFAWTQTRLNLPAWLGVGEALEKELETNADTLREMYRDWPWFATVIDLVEMILAQSEEDIAANYDAQLVGDPAALALGEELRTKLQSTTSAVLRVSEHQVLHENNPRMLKMMATRNPYVDPLNLIQVGTAC